MKISFLAFLLLFGCATFDERMAPTRDSWQGVAYEDVIKRWGAPVRSAGQTHTWVAEGGGRRGGVTPSVGIFGGSGGGVGMGAGVGFGSSGGESERCERILTFRDGVVAEQSWIGSADYCATFGRRVS